MAKIKIISTRISEDVLSEIVNHSGTYFEKNRDLNKVLGLNPEPKIPESFNETVQDNIVAIYNSGVAVKRLARAYRVRDNIISKILRDRGNGARIKFKLSEKQEKELVRRYLAKEPLADLYKDYSVSSHTVVKIVKRHGHIVNSRGPQYTEFSPEVIEDMGVMWRGGYSQAKLASVYKTSQSVISRVLREAGLDDKTRIPVNDKHGKWKGGRTITGNGYVLIKIHPDHKFSSMKNRSGYVLEHRLVMAEHLGRELTPSETVHHINGYKKDNRPENLQIMQGRHGNGTRLLCNKCGSHDITAVELEDSL